MKILTTMSIFRYGLGLRGIGFGLVVVIFSFGISWLVMEPAISKAGGVRQIASGETVSDELLEGTFKPFVQAHIDPDVKARLQRYRKSLHAERGAELEEDTFSLLLPAFLVSELKDAFFLGFLFIVPFFIIDLLVANAILVLGMTNLETFVVAFPLKLLLFFSVDGWTLISERLIGSYLL